MTTGVHLVDVAPRDGLQGVKPMVPTKRKLELINQLLAVGINTLEAGSFVHPAMVPQMQDSPKIANTLAGSSANIYFLIPNLKGFEIANQHRVDKLVFTVSASAKHNMANVKQSIDQSLTSLQKIIHHLKAGDAFTLSLSACFDCPFDGKMPPSQVLDLVGKLVDMMQDNTITWAINLADTTGKGTPDAVHKLCQDITTKYATTPIEWGFHGHDTYGHGIANAYAAWCSGIRRFEGSIGGIGGCPFAPGASGNTATEDLVYLFENMGIRTGTDWPGLLKLANATAAIDGVIPGGRIRLLPARLTLTG